MRIINKIKKEIIFFTKKRKNKFCRGGSIIGPQYFRFGKKIHIGKCYKLHCFDKYRNKYKYAPNLVISDNVYIGDYFTILNAATISIGENSLIASNVSIFSLNHGIYVSNNSTFESQPLTVKDVAIGKNCWIGEKVVILPGVTIGDNCIIGAGSVVTKNIEANHMAAGNPARMIKKWDFNTESWCNINEKN